MKASELNQIIVTLLSSTRRPDNVRHCSSLSSRQITESIASLLAPDHESQHRMKLREQVDKQLKNLESEFEIRQIGEGRKMWQMSPPSLIIEWDTPIRARFVGDRAYFNTVVDLLEANGNQESLVVESSKTASEARELLEPRGISVQSEEMFFEFLPNPRLPTEIELIKAELLMPEEVNGIIEVYVPQRALFDPKNTKRWISSNEVLHINTSMYRLRRIREKSFRNGYSTYTYFWEDAGKKYRLQKEQALLAMYRIDMDQNKARLLDLETNIPASVKQELPVEYLRLLDRYTERGVDSAPSGESGDKVQNGDLQVRSKYKREVEKLLAKLGINSE